MRLDDLCDRIRADFGIAVGEVTPIGHGADAAAAVWMVRAGDARYAVKWTGGGSAAGLLLPDRLASLGVSGVPAPVRTLDGALWSEHGGRRLSLQPWVGDTRAVDAGLTPAQWTAFGALLARVHAVPPDDAVARELPVEQHRPDAVLTATAAVTARFGSDDGHGGHGAGGHSDDGGGGGDHSDGHGHGDDRGGDGGGDRGDDGGDDLVRELAAAWRDGAELLGALTARAAVLGARLRDRPARAVVCHTDAHLGNVLLRSRRAVVGRPLPARVVPTLRAGTDTPGARTPDTPPTPAASTPGTPTPAAPTPGTPTPGTPTPGAPLPAAHTPAAGTPDAPTPRAQTPGTHTPAAGTPGTPTPAAHTPGTGTPDAGTPGAEVWLIDWDDATLAPPERDLMFVVGGLPGYAPVGERELGWFAAGYGRVDVDPDRLAYYRAVRALGDLTEFAAQLLDPSGDRAAREFALSVVRAELAGRGLAGLAAGDRGA